MGRFRHIPENLEEPLPLPLLTESLECSEYRLKEALEEIHQLKTHITMLEQQVAAFQHSALANALRIYQV